MRVKGKSNMTSKSCSLVRGRTTEAASIATAVLLFLLVAGCHGNAGPANHLIMFDAPPDGISPHKATPFDIRTNFSGSVNLVESRDFRIVVNVTAPSLRQAYEVKADLVADGHGGMVLEVTSDDDATPLLINMTWLFIAILAAAVLTMIFTAVHSIRWYKMECPKYEYSDRKSLASSSQRGAVYRSRNSVQLVVLPPGSDHGLRADEGDDLRNGRGDDELRKVQEMPEEEEAEALEMEHLSKIKFKEDSDVSSVGNEDSDPQERNLKQSRYNSHSKTLHKELMLKKSSGSSGKRQPSPSYRRTHNGKYEGVPTNDTGHADDVTGDDEKAATRRSNVAILLPGSSDKLWSSGDLRVRVDGVDKSTGSLSTFGKTPMGSASDKENMTCIRTPHHHYKSDSDLRHHVPATHETDPMRLVMADVHHKTSGHHKHQHQHRQQAGRPEMVSIHPRGVEVASSSSSSPSSSSSRASGNIYVPTSELKPGGMVLSTFGQISPISAPSSSRSSPTAALGRISNETAGNTPNNNTSAGTTTASDDNAADRTTYQYHYQPQFSDPLSQDSVPSEHPSAPPLQEQTPSSPALSSSRRIPEPIWCPSGLVTMGDIPEDPREDDLSAISGSIKSASMYGSSEIFDSNEVGNTYCNMDSDIDIPPLDSDDIMSDVGLPSPRGWPMRRSMGEKGKTNDDIKLIPGALKSPGANMGRHVNPKPRPNSSIIMRADQGKGGGGGGGGVGQVAEQKAKVGQLAGNTAELPPPRYEDVAAESKSSVFQFPPPPKFYQPGQPIPWRSSSDDGDGAELRGEGSNGDYVQIKHNKDGASGVTAGRGEVGGVVVGTGVAGDKDGTELGTERGGGGGRGKKSALSPTYMNLTILSTLCILTLATGVFSQLSSQEMRVDIVVFAPAHFFSNTTRLFFNGERDTEATGLEDKHVIVYDSPNPIRHPQEEAWMAFFCGSNLCSQGCDEKRGTCVCLKGYRLDDAFSCVDVNECMEGRARCDPYAGCYNRKGSYDCICGEDFYGDGKSCRECHQPCPSSHYEVRPCTQDKKKICGACTRSCRHGFYLSKRCASHRKGTCRVCQPACGEAEYESRQCSNIHDRECSNLTELQPPVISSNVIFEDRSKATDGSVKVEKLPEHYVGFSRYNLHRGTGFVVEITVRFMDPTLRFLPVNLTQPFDLQQVAPSVLSSFDVQRYCPSPVPDYYKLSYGTHKDLTYKLWDNGSIAACETHQMFGVFLNEDGSDDLMSSSFSGGSKSPGRDSFVCAQPGTLTNIFNMEEEMFHARTKWVDKSKRCQRNSHACEQCTRDCGTSMISGGTNCSMSPSTAHNENGKSPRLMTCYNCCVRKNCSKDCKDYHKRKCQPERCSKGTLIKFTVAPSWDSSQDGQFFCHIQPQTNQRLLELDYTVRHVSLHAPIDKFSVTLHGDKKWQEKGEMKYSDGIIEVLMDSGLDEQVPNFLEGVTSSASSIFKVGQYKWHGSAFGSSNIQSDFVLLRPSAAVSVPSMPRAQQECSFRALDKFLLASKMENPYLHDSDMEAVAASSSDSGLPFVVTHKGRKPEVTVRLRPDLSLLKRLYATVTVVDNSFHGNLQHNGTHWVVAFSAQVSRCPGYLRVRIQDPNYPSHDLFDGDLAVLCPLTFNLTLALATSDDVGMFKDVLITLHDADTVHNFRLYRTARLNEKELRRKDDVTASVIPVEGSLPYASRQYQSYPQAEQVQNLPNYPLGLPYLLALAGIVILLLVLAIIGLCFQPGIPDTPYAHWYHPLFAILYVTFQFIYAVIISGSFFFLLLAMTTSAHVSFVTRHGQEGVVSTASSHVELLHLQRHLEKEINRQYGLGDAYQDLCVKDVRKLVDDMNTMQQKLLKETADVFERYRLDLLLEQQKIYIRQKLSKDLDKFRENYAKSARSILRRINQDAAASHHNVVNTNTWLDGARLVNDGVNLFRHAKQKRKQSLMEWTGIKANESRLAIDLSFSLPALPRLDDMVMPQDHPPIKRDLRDASSSEAIRSVQVHNNWFFPLDEVSITSVPGFKAHKQNDDNGSTRRASFTFYMFLGILAVFDLVLLGHRVCKAWTTAKLILFGFPEYFRGRKEDEMGDDEVFDSKDSRNKLAPVYNCRNSPKTQTVKLFFTKTISTPFLSKIIGAVAACVVSICVLQMSSQLLTVQGLRQVGLYHNASSKSVNLRSTLTNARLEAHAEYINHVDYPSFQALTAVHLNSHRVVLEFYRNQMYGLQNLTSEIYCLHLKAIGVQDDCDPIQWAQPGASTDARAWEALTTVTHSCTFKPVEARLFSKMAHSDSFASERQVESVLENLRHIIYQTCRLIIIFLAAIVIKELAFAVIWILIQRSGAIRLRIIVEQDQDDSAQ